MPYVFAGSSTPRKRYAMAGTKGYVMAAPPKKKVKKAVPTNSYLSKTRFALGQSPNLFPAVAYQDKTNGAVLMPSNTQNGVSCINNIIRKSVASGFKLNDREGDVIYLSGVKISAVFRNNQTASNDTAIYLNMALVSTKAGIANVSTSDFFTSGAGVTRSVDFDDAGLTALERHTLPINSDNYTVHWHERKVLISTGNSSGQDSIGIYPKFIKLEKYIPLKRQIRYDSTNGVAESPLWLIHWAGVAGEASGVAATTNVYSVDRNMMVYFRNP